MLLRQLDVTIIVGNSYSSGSEWEINPIYSYDVMLIMCLPYALCADMLHLEKGTVVPAEMK